MRLNAFVAAAEPEAEHDAQRPRHAQHRKKRVQQQRSRRLKARPRLRLPAERAADQQRRIADAIAGRITVTLEEVAVKSNLIVDLLANLDGFGHFRNNYTDRVVIKGFIEYPALILNRHAFLGGNRLGVEFAQALEPAFNVHDLPAVFLRLLEEVRKREIAARATR